MTTATFLPRSLPLPLPVSNHISVCVGSLFDATRNMFLIPDLLLPGSAWMILWCGLRRPKPTSSCRRRANLRLPRPSPFFSPHVKLWSIMPVRAQNAVVRRPFTATYFRLRLQWTYFLNHRKTRWVSGAQDIMFTNPFRPTSQRPLLQAFADPQQRNSIFAGCTRSSFTQARLSRPIAGAASSSLLFPTRPRALPRATGCTFFLRVASRRHR